MLTAESNNGDEQITYNLATAAKVEVEAYKANQRHNKAGILISNRI